MRRVSAQHIDKAGFSPPPRRFQYPRRSKGTIDDLGDPRGIRVRPQDVADLVRLGDGVQVCRACRVAGSLGGQSRRFGTGFGRRAVGIHRRQPLPPTARRTGDEGPSRRHRRTRTRIIGAGGLVTGDQRLRRLGNQRLRRVGDKARHQT